jgi:methyl-accepting chemotaxis protein
MARSVNEAAGGAGSIAASLEQVAGSARSASEGIAETQRSAGELAQLSAQLRSLVGKFRV